MAWPGLSGCRGYYSEARDVGEEAYDYGREVLGAEHYLDPAHRD